MTDFAWPVILLKNDLVGVQPNWPQRTMYPLLASYYKEGKTVSGSMISEGHPRSRDGKFREGGPWMMNKLVSTRTGVPRSCYRSGYPEVPCYIGRFYCNAQGIGSAFSSQEEQWEHAYEKGAEAFARLKPTRPDFTGALSLLEMKDLVNPLRENVKDLRDRVWRERRLRIRNNRSSISRISEFHLAVQFGWLPLLSDVRKFCQAFQGRKARFNQLVRDEGKPVRRRVTLENHNNSWTTVSDTTTNYSTPYNPDMLPSMVTQAYATGFGSNTRKIQRTRRKTWAVGQMRYLLPPGPRDEAWKASIMRKIMGANITPSQAYNLIPWSFLVDYFTGLGSFFEAVSGIENNLICDYAYVMQQREDEIEWHCTQSIISKTTTGNVNTARSVTCTGNNRRTFKVRSPASIFGWGINDDSLTPHQVSILGALGGSKL